MRILVLNANTTDFVTQTAANEARRVGIARHRDRAGHGRLWRRDRGDAQRARDRRARRRRARRAPCAGLRRGGDRGVLRHRPEGAARDADVPVVGMTEAALLTACMLGGPIGLIGFGKRVWPMYRELIEGYGLCGPHRRQARAGEHVGLQAGRLLGARCRTGRRRERPDREGRRREHHPARCRDGGRCAPHRGARAGAGARRHALRDPAG